MGGLRGGQGVVGGSKVAREPWMAQRGWATIGGPPNVSTGSPNRPTRTFDPPDI
jgi:hypothetical protein